MQPALRTSASLSYTDAFGRARLLYTVYASPGADEVWVGVKRQQICRLSIAQKFNAVARSIATEPCLPAAR